MDFEKEENSFTASEWQKDASAGKKDFDFDAFLRDDLEDRITAALDGKDLLAPDAFGESVENYKPRRVTDSEHGRHEAPEPVSTAQYVPETSAVTSERKKADPSDPRYAAPERPRVVVAEPRPKVYVTPPSGGEDEPPERRDRNPRKGLIWAVVILAIIAIAVGGLLAILRSGSRWDGGADDRPVPTSQSEATPTPAADDATPAPTATPAEATPTPTAPPQVTTYHVTVTAGSGGKVSPSGAVAVEKGDTVTFTITPDAGYELAQLLLDGSPIQLTDTVRIANVAGDHTLYAVFQPSATPTPEPTATPTPTPEPTATPEPTTPPAPDEGDSGDTEPSEP